MTGSRSPRRPVARCERSRQEKSTDRKSLIHGDARRGSLPASGGAKVWAKTSLRSSAAPLTLAALPDGRARRLGATTRSAANQSKADQRQTYAAVAPNRNTGLCSCFSLKSQISNNRSRSVVKSVMHRTYGKHEIASSAKHQCAATTAMLQIENGLQQRKQDYADVVAEE